MIFFYKKNFYNFFYSYSWLFNRSINVACDNDHLEVVKELLKDPRVDPFDNFSCVMKYACKNGHLEVVKELLKDPRINFEDPYTRLSFHLASKNGHLEIVKELLKDSRMNPFHSKINYANKNCLRELTNNISKKYLFEEMNFILDIEELISPKNTEI